MKKLVMFAFLAILVMGFVLSFGVVSGEDLIGGGCNIGDLSNIITIGECKAEQRCEPERPDVNCEGLSLTDCSERDGCKLGGLRGCTKIMIWNPPDPPYCGESNKIPYNSIDGRVDAYVQAKKNGCKCVECYVGPNSEIIPKVECPKKEGVCSGTTKMCQNNKLLDCEDTSLEISAYGPDYDGEKEIRCEDEKDNDCDGLIDDKDPDCKNGCLSDGIVYNVGTIKPIKEKNDRDTNHCKTKLYKCITKTAYLFKKVFAWEETKNSENFEKGLACKEGKKEGVCDSNGKCIIGCPLKGKRVDIGTRKIIQSKGDILAGKCSTPWYVCKYNMKLKESVWTEEEGEIFNFDPEIPCFNIIDGNKAWGNCDGGGNCVIGAEVCNDVLDNDGDGEVDCEDIDCKGKQCNPKDKNERCVDGGSLVGGSNLICKKPENCGELCRNVYGDIYKGGASCVSAKRCTGTGCIQDVDCGARTTGKEACDCKIDVTCAEDSKLKNDASSQDYPYWGCAASVEELNKAYEWIKGSQKCDPDRVSAVCWWGKLEGSCNPDKDLKGDCRKCVAIIGKGDYYVWKEDIKDRPDPKENKCMYCSFIVIERKINNVIKVSAELELRNYPDDWGCRFWESEGDTFYGGKCKNGNCVKYEQECNNNADCRDRCVVVGKKQQHKILQFKCEKEKCTISDEILCPLEGVFSFKSYCSIYPSNLKKLICKEGIPGKARLIGEGEEIEVGKVKPGFIFPQFRI